MRRVFKQCDGLWHGGSSLCPEVAAANVWTSGRSFPELLVLDSNDPDTINNFTADRYGPVFVCHRVESPERHGAECVSSLLVQRVAQHSAAPVILLCVTTLVTNGRHGSS